MSALLRLEDVASRLGISYSQARTLVLVEGAIPHLRVGERGIRVPTEALEAYIASKSAAAKDV